MLSAHPHIKYACVKDVFINDYKMRRLVVDTDLAMPKSGRIEENEELLQLHNFLEDMALKDMSDVDEVEIRTPVPSAMRSFHGRNAA